MYIKISNPLFHALQPSWIPFPRFQTTVHGELEYVFETPRDQFFIEESQPAVSTALRYATRFLNKKQRKNNESL